MGWFTKQTAQAFRPKRTKGAVEDEMMRNILAIPLSRWDETMGGFATVADSGTIVEVKYWRLNCDDDSSYSNCALLINGTQVPVEKSKIEQLYKTLLRRWALAR